MSALRLLLVIIILIGVGMIIQSDAQEILWEALLRPST